MAAAAPVIHGVRLREGAQPRNKADLWKLFRTCDPLQTLEAEVNFIQNKGWPHVDAWHNGGFRAAEVERIASFLGNDKLHGIPLLAVAIVLFRNERIGFASDNMASDYLASNELIDIDEAMQHKILATLTKIWQAAVARGMQLAAPIKLEDVPFKELIKDVDFKVDAALLGSGAFGRVHRATYLSNNFNVAYKELFIVDDRAQVDSFNSEVEVLRLLSHPNIVRVYGKSTSPYHLGLIVELMDGSLKTKLAGLTIPQRKYVLTELAKGLEYLHTKDAGGVNRPRVLHRDLKAENALVSNDLKVVKLSDFGLSRTITSTQVASTIVGTPLMMAPEVTDDNDDDGYHTSADVWSFGMLMFEVLAGCMPYKVELARKEIKLKKGFHIGGGKPPSKEPIRDPADPEVVKMVTIMDMCIQQDPKARPSMSDVVAWLQSENAPAVGVAHAAAATH